MVAEKNKKKFGRPPAGQAWAQVLVRPGSRAASGAPKMTPFWSQTLIKPCKNEGFWSKRGSQTGPNDVYLRAENPAGRPESQDDVYLRAGRPPAGLAWAQVLVRPGSRAASEGLEMNPFSKQNYIKPCK